MYVKAFEAVLARYDTHGEGLLLAGNGWRRRYGGFMNQEGGFISASRDRFLCGLVLVVFGLIAPCVDGADSPFRAQGRLTEVNFKNGEPFQTQTFEVKAVVAQGKWCIYMSGSEDSESAVFFDGTNQFAVSRNLKEPAGQTLHAFVAESEVPYGGGLGQTAWFNFCRQRWGSRPREAFPNLMSYEGDLGMNNAKLTLAEHNDDFDATFEFADGNARWLVEKWHGESVDKATGVPRKSERKIFSHVGMMVNGKWILPTAGRVFDKTLRTVRIEVSKIEMGDFSEELTPPWLGHGLISMADKRFSSDGSMIVYTVTNRIPTKGEMWKSPEMRKVINQQAPGQSELR